MARHAIHRQILQLWIPASLDVLSQASLGLIDQVIIGRLGEVALAAVGLTNHVMFPLLLILGTLGSGVAILVSHHCGQDDPDGVSRITTSALLLGLCVTLPIVGLLIAFPKGILRLLGAEADVISTGWQCFCLIVITLPAVQLSAIAAGVLRSLGDAWTPLGVTLGAALLNTLLGMALVNGVGPVAALGVTGAGWATLVAQLSRQGALLWVLAKRKVLQASKPTPSSKKPLVRRLMRLTWPMALAQVLWSMGGLLHTLLCARLGTSALVAHQIVIVLESVFILCVSGLGVAGLTMVGQRLGAGDQAGARASSREIISLGLRVAAALGLALAAMSLVLRGLYPNLGHQTLTLATLGLVFQAVLQPAKVLNIMLGEGVLRAGGDTRFLLVANTLSIYAVGMPVVLVLTLGLGTGWVGILIGKAAEEVARAGLFLLRYRSRRWLNEPSARGPRVSMQWSMV